MRRSRPSGRRTVDPASVKASASLEGMVEKQPATSTRPYLAGHGVRPMPEASVVTAPAHQLRNLIHHYGLRRMNVRGLAGDHKTTLLPTVTHNLKKLLRYQPQQYLSAVIALPSPCQFRIYAFACAPVGL